MIIMSSDNTTIMEYYEIIICKVNIFGYNAPNGKHLLGEYNTSEEAKKVMRMISDSIETGEKIFCMPKKGSNIIK